MIKILTPAAKIFIFFIGAYFSYKHCASYWVVGPIFGVVVIVWNARSLPELTKAQNLAFLFCSTVIYALVYWIASRNSDRGFFVAVAVGAVLLPVAHKIYFSVSWKRTLIVIPCLYGLWYGIGSLIAQLHFEGTMETIVNYVSIWQVLYIALFFWPINRTMCMIRPQNLADR